jgi:hypothetical protein
VRGVGGVIGVRGRPVHRRQLCSSAPRPQVVFYESVIEMYESARRLLEADLEQRSVTTLPQRRQFLNAQVPALQATS